MKIGSSKVSRLIITFFLGAIMFAFILTGFEGFSGNSGAVATVDGTAIEHGEYRRALDNQINRYSQMFGGKSLTSQQIRQFGIKENVLRSLVQQKMMLNFAKNELNIATSVDEVKDEIKNSTLFQTNKKFDVNLYRGLLARNGYTPAKYETIVQEQIKSQKLQNLLNSYTPSNIYAQDVLDFKNTKAKVIAASFTKENNTKYITVSKAEISTFVKDSKNKAKLEALYKTANAEFNKPEKVKARHILLKTDGKDEKAVLKEITAIRKGLNKNNFKKIANKKTEDASGKSKGGSLGEFGRGAMVPEFDKVVFSLKPGVVSQPVKTKFGYHLILVDKKIKAQTKKLTSVQDILAKRHLQKTKRTELSQFNDKLENDLSELIKTGNTTKLKQLTRKYGVTLLNNSDVNVYDLKVGNLTFDQTKLSEMLINKDTTSVLKESDATKVSIVKLSSFTQTKVQDKAIKTELSSLKASIDKEVTDTILKNLEKKSKVVTHPNLL